jgi:cytochrome c peroxidase
MRLRAAVAIACGVAVAAGALAQTPVRFTPEEVAAIARHGPWPVPFAKDASNRVSGAPAAIAFGERLFFSARLSPSGTVACATCHRPELNWTDGEARAIGLERVDRNTLPVWNQPLNRWYGWDGGSDSLWAHTIRPMLDAREMGASAASIARAVRSNADLACGYEQAYGGAPAKRDDDALLVDVAKALAAYQEQLATGRAPFDAFRDAIVAGDAAGVAAYPEAAKRGLRIFLGEGQCNMCHVGPNFTNGEFHDVGIPYFVERGRVDPGRHAGLRHLAESPYTRAGRWSDDPGKRATGAAHVAREHRNWGEFRTPSLRNVAQTAPYMHAGSLATLRDVVRHYNEIDMERLHVDGERILGAMYLSRQEQQDLVAFLETLTGPVVAPAAQAMPRCR